MRKVLLGAALAFASSAQALDGEILVHDPSTVIVENGRYYTFGTGAGIPILASNDGWTWERVGSVADGVKGGLPTESVLTRGGRNTWAPDIIKSGDRYFMYYSAPATQPKAAIGLLAGRTLNWPPG